LDKLAKSSFPIHELIAARWSPRAFAPRAVEPEVLGSLLEAARWAPSCFNEQPWSFLVAPAADADSFERLAACLSEGNAWAKRAPVLMLSVAKLAFDRNGKPNRHAYHDVGLAVENLVLQAQALGLSVHQMAGFDVERARANLGIPAGHDPVAMIAVGYRGSADDLPDALRERELAPRSRKALAAFAFGARWGEPLRLAALPLDQGH
jgi:nitroreductase